MEITLSVIFTLLGIAVGSFLNVCIDRLPAGGSLVSPPSCCDRCRHRLSPRDLIPVFSYLWLRGRCRYCGAPIPLRSPLVELLSGLLFFLAFHRYGLSAEFAVTAFYCSIFVIIIFTDLEHHLILNKVTYPAAIAALIILAVDFFLPRPGLFGESLFWPEPKILSGLIGGAAGFIFFLIPLLIYPAGMGAGDVKMGGLIGLVTGFPMVLVALFIGIVCGGLSAIFLLAFKLKSRKDPIPYGPFLALGPIVTLLYGTHILEWYLGLF